ITNRVKILESEGYEVFEAARKFMEEFDELQIIAKYIDSFGEEDYDVHSTCYEYMKYYYEHNANYNEKVGEQTIPVCRLHSGEYVVCISESGKFFVSEGMWAKDTDNFWNGLLGEYKGGFLNWKDYKAGKEFQRSKYKNEEYF
ncbi:SUKH-3 domain-containing protein, partial [Clostridium sp. CMCC3677]|uniref:SUKH-3 domain-containing protein n=1 Tax=Clostridium sp. CMCC3677 TaxID=2949963 RepID=UPI00207955F9